MATIKKKKRVMIHSLEITELERFRQFEIKLPANVKKVTGVIITVSQI
jgi:hypothetical protein